MDWLGNLGGKELRMETAYAKEMRKRVEAARQLRADMAEYDAWLDGEVKDCTVNFRIAKSDLVKLKALARSRNMKYQTCLREIVKREIQSDIGGQPLKGGRVRERY
jgi:predicted DNA binding CopG/RHH family protein